jgi:hypothetical protein
MTNESSAVPVKYVLYSHYAFNEKKDFQAWKDGTPISDLVGVKFLLDHLRGLRELLTSPAYEGLLVLFYAPGFADCFDGIERGKDLETLVQESKPLQFGRAVGEWIAETLYEDQELSCRLRFVTPLDLHSIFGRLNALEAENLRLWVIGSTGEVFYDVPKIVEAIVRLRLLGNGVPVFRLDWDVLFRGKENKDLADLGLFKPVASCLRAYRLRIDEPTVASFLFSASYDTRGLRDSLTRDKFSAWRGAFATRVFPALAVVPENIDRVHAGHITWDQYAEAENVFDVTLARRFYGFSDASLRMEGVEGLAQIGAHPHVSVVSGALLCFSEGAILDLPPFSNFSLNVSWIDDHLKYCLHRELRHLSTAELQIEPLLSDAKLDQVMVPKARGEISNLPNYVLGNYIPTLLWGAIMDAWITPDPLLKCRPNDLQPELAAAWRSLHRRGPSQGVLPAALQQALRAGHFKPSTRFALRAELQRIALARINQVRKQWATLTAPGKETFASLWAKGQVADYFPQIEPRCLGIAPGTPITTDITQVAQLNAHLQDDFKQVLEDAVEYIRWTLNWPHIVQVVRSIEGGTLRTDLSWRP